VWCECLRPPAPAVVFRPRVSLVHIEAVPVRWIARQHVVLVVVLTTTATTSSEVPRRH
jgi:hypothetical protein